MTTHQLAGALVECRGYAAISSALIRPSVPDLGLAVGERAW